MELWAVWNEPACAVSVETFGVHCDELLQCFVDWERVGLPEILECLKAIFFWLSEPLPHNLELKCAVESRNGCRWLAVAALVVVTVVIVVVTLKGHKLRQHVMRRSCKPAVLFVGSGIRVGKPAVVVWWP